MEKIYISGKITGIENEAPVYFENAEKELKIKGFDPINPIKIKHDHDLSWTNYMKTDLIALLGCTSIYMLKNWKDSTGAKIERDLAINLGYKVIYE